MIRKVITVIVEIMIIIKTLMIITVTVKLCSTPACSTFSSININLQQQVN